MAERPELHPISCTRCRDKKIRCSRMIPECGNCRDTGNTCAYPERARKRTRATLTNTPIRTKTNQRGSPSSPWRAEQMPNHAKKPLLPATLQRGEKRMVGPLEYGLALCRSRGDACHSVTTEIDADRSHTHTPTATFSSTSTTPLSVSGTGRTGIFIRELPTSSAVFVCSNALDAVRDAVHEVRGLVVQRFTNVASISKGAVIPKDLAKLWITEFLEHAPTDLFTNLIDMDLIQLLPDIISRPHIRIDASIIVIYFCVLYYGSSMSNGKPSPSLHWSRQLYLCSLRALPGWQREAVGSQADFMAAICMMRVSMENFDAELGWRMYRRACTYAEGLRLHLVDGTDNVAVDSEDRPVLDQRRKSFWELVQIDLFFQLVYGKPPTLTACMESWKVNLPWLTGGVEHNEDTTSAIQFLVSSRLTFAITEFFHLMDSISSDTEMEKLLDKVEKICVQVENLYTEWNLEDWMKKLSQDILQLWIVTDTALTGYCCLIFMLRRVTAKVEKLGNLESADAVVAKMPLALRVSRQMLTTAHVLLQAITRLDILSITWDAFHLHLPYTYLARSLLDGTDTESYEKDATLLDSLSHDVEVVSREEAEVRPLFWAMQELNAELSKASCKSVH